MIDKSEVIAMGIVMPVVCITVVALRFYVKATVNGRPGVDDIFITLSLLGLLGGTVITLGGAFKGFLGTSAPAVYQMEDNLNADSGPFITESRHWTETWQILQNLIYGLTKISVLFFYRTIFIGQLFNVLSILLLGVVTTWTILAFFFYLLQCGAHVEALWTNAAYVAKHCMPAQPIGLSFAGVDVFTDLLILLLPMYWVSKLQLPPRKKLLVAGVFLFGAITIASSIIRLAMLSAAYPGHSSTPDQFAYDSVLVYFGMLESGLGIIAACLPTLGPLVLGWHSRRRYQSHTEDPYNRAAASRFGFSSRKTSPKVTPRQGTLGTQTSLDDELEMHDVAAVKRMESLGVARLNPQTLSTVETTVESDSIEEGQTNTASGITVTTQVDQQSHVR